MRLLVLCLVAATLLWPALAQAPGDREADCGDNDHTYPSEWYVLFDTWNYVDLFDGGPLRVLNEDGGRGWTAGSGGCCREHLLVSDNDQPTQPQNNWVFTQFINFDEATEIFVNIDYQYIRCSRNASTVCNILPTLYERNGADEAMRINTTNYNRLKLLSINGSDFSGVRTFTFLPSTNANGFYLGLQDTGTDSSIERMTAYYRVCPGRNEGLLTIPEVPLPPMNSTKPVTRYASCASNSYNTTSLKVTATIDSCPTAAMPTYSMCLCNTGLHSVMQPDGTKECQDINECNTNNGDCQQICTNTEGLRECSCRSGFVIERNGCKDINECDTNNGGCSQTCTNTPGSRVCSCSFGYRLSRNGRTCLDVNECNTNNGGCQQICTNTQGSRVCSCRSGFVPDRNGCRDINECVTNNGGCSQTCTNTPGSRVCSCSCGFTLASNGRVCIETPTPTTPTPCPGNFAVRISVDYNPPANFIPGPNEYRAASGPVTVTCTATGTGTGSVSYRWSSTCRSCPFQSATSNSIIRPAVHSGDTGTHTCVATRGGSTASASIDFRVVDAGVQVFSGTPRGNLPTNGLVISAASGTRLRFFCRSDSMSENVGQLIGLDGTTAVTSNNFFEIARSQPGELMVRNAAGSQSALTASQQGVYTCRIPLQSGQMREINVGVYPNGLSTPPRAVALTSESISSHTALTCTTTGSPATTVTWTRDGQPVTIDGHTYSMVQTVTNRASATYENVLIVSPPTLGSTFTCTVTNILGSDTSNSITVRVKSCRVGFRLDTDDRNCNDIDECDTNNGGCSQTCTNTPGSRVCSCRTGFRLSSNGRTCLDINECNTNNGGCEQICTNTQGSRLCSCRSGFVIERNGCRDINECDTNNGGCSQTCTNTPGSRECSCRCGYRLSSDGGTCLDINECNTNNGGCQQICTNTQGSRVCSCRSGFVIERNGCRDINECDTNNGNCQQSCTNTPGSRVCSCRAGFRLASNGRTCQDINECNTNNGDCQHICTNTQGSRVCSCRSGFVTDRNGCRDINECDTNNGGCSQTCTNTPGSRVCSCSCGFRLASNGRMCIVPGCSQIRTVSGECRCRAGYRLQCDGRICTEIPTTATPTCPTCPIAR